MCCVCVCVCVLSHRDTQTLSLSLSPSLSLSLPLPFQWSRPHSSCQRSFTECSQGSHESQPTSPDFSSYLPSSLLCHCLHHTTRRVYCLHEALSRSVGEDWSLCLPQGMLQVYWETRCVCSCGQAWSPIHPVMYVYWWVG